MESQLLLFVDSQFINCRFQSLRSLISCSNLKIAVPNISKSVQQNEMKAFRNLSLRISTHSTQFSTNQKIHMTNKSILIYWYFWVRVFLTFDKNKVMKRGFVSSTFVSIWLFVYPLCMHIKCFSSVGKRLFSPFSMAFKGSASNPGDDSRLGCL